MEIKNVFVVGAGLMGSGISQVVAQSGYNVWMCDISQDALDKAMNNIRWSLGKFADKGKLKEAVDIVIKRIQPVLNYDEASKADIVIEAVFEKLDLKQKVFREIDSIAPPHAIFASNTSAISITELAASVKRQDLFIGLHFFSPVQMMAAVEVIRAVTTSEEAFLLGRDFVKSLGKEPIMVNRDIPGFLLNRINLPSTIEAIKLVEAGVASVEDIDKGVKLAFGRKMGIFETGDMVGLDVTYSALMALYEETKDPRWYPPELLRRKVRVGHLGKKTGMGWYKYNEDGKPVGPAI